MLSNQQQDDWMHKAETSRKVRIAETRTNINGAFKSTAFGNTHFFWKKINKNEHRQKYEQQAITRDLCYPEGKTHIIIPIEFAKQTDCFWPPREPWKTQHVKRKDIPNHEVLQI